jgi:hypothetical protein
MGKFTNYDITISDGTTAYILTYDLYDHRPAQVWANMMKYISIGYLRPGLDPWHGVHRDPTPIVDELELLTNELNKWIEPKTGYKINMNWDFANHQSSVNKYHTHFPEHNDEDDPIRRRQLENYNDLIHRIEAMSRLGSGDNLLHLLLCPEHPGGFAEVILPMEDEDFHHFSTEHPFGALTMGYSHIGRHPIELYYSQDTNVPAEQIIPQSVLGTIHYLFFHWSGKVTDEEFAKFYQESKIKWPYAVDDPKLAVGMINMGILAFVENVSTQTILENEDDKFGKSSNQKKIIDIAKSCNKVIDWKVY